MGSARRGSNPLAVVWFAVETRSSILYGSVRDWDAFDVSRRSCACAFASVGCDRSPLWGSSPRPYAYEAHALPAELRRLLHEMSCVGTRAIHVLFGVCNRLKCSRRRQQRRSPSARDAACLRVTAVILRAQRPGKQIHLARFELATFSVLG